MSKYYLSYDIDHYHSKQENGYIILEAFKRDIRVELKMAYNALFNLMLTSGRFDANHACFLEKDIALFSKTLEQLANKPVSREKMLSYLDELVAHDLLETNENRVYVLRLL